MGFAPSPAKEACGWKETKAMLVRGDEMPMKRYGNPSALRHFMEEPTRAEKA